MPIVMIAVPYFSIKIMFDSIKFNFRFLASIIESSICYHTIPFYTMR